MDRPHRKVSITPPEGEAIARYTVKVRPKEVFFRRLYQRLAPAVIKSAVKLFALWWIFFFIKRFNVAVIKALFGVSERIGDYASPIVIAYLRSVWIFDLIFWLFFAYLLLRTVRIVIAAQSGARTAAASAQNEEYAFFDTGFIYSNGKDLCRVDKKKIRLIIAAPAGLIIHAPGATDTLIIPARYFCREYPKLEETLKKYAPGRFWRFKKLGRDRAPAYQNPREKIAIPAPVGDRIAELNVKLRFSDLGYIYALYQRQIAKKYHRGLFLTLLLMLSSVALFIAGIILRDAALLPLAAVTLGVAVLYALFVSLSGFFKGRRLLVNRRDYKKPVKYIFCPAGFLLVYENGISHVMYEDLELIFEDDEGMAFFFSKKQCLFIPADYTRSVEGRRLSHFFKASLFNLDPDRGRSSRVDEQMVALEKAEKKAHEKRMRRIRKLERERRKKQDEGGNLGL